MIRIENRRHFDKVKNEEFLLAIFYTDTSEKSKEALKILEEFKKENKDVSVCSINASRVKDIHPLYGINTVPTVLLLKKGKPSKVIYGKQDKEFYKRLLYEAPVPSTSKKEERKFHRVTVYTSTGCPWCAATKSYLTENRIPFNEINVSENSRAAEELVRRSGQLATPQTDIDGEIVIGFDKAKLATLLGIRKS